MELISRQEARAIGQTWYFTGVPCKYGHVAKRQVRGGCMQCSKERSERFYAANREDQLRKQREHRQANLDEWKAARREAWKRRSPEQKARDDQHRRNYAARVKADPVRLEEQRKRCRDNWHATKHLPRIQESRRRYWEANREKLNAKKREWKKKNKDRVCAHTRARQAGLNAATPAWVDRDAILAVYTARDKVVARTGIDHHVDHIIPLTHPDVCGLHVPWNLQVIPAVDNMSKGNKLAA